ncbi:MAG TPA: hypothetical protein VNN72_21995 [Polyangiaceae bacterium]|nr:hypothetical protein [Polyangiaceae bacterium]
MGFFLRMLGVGVALSAIGVACSGSDFSSADAPKGGSGGMAGSGAKGGSGGSDSGASGDTSTAGTPGAAGTQSGSGGTGAMGGTAGGGTVRCSDAADCDDGKPCTLDVCLASGVCDNPPLCGGDTPACCNGTCSQCCGADDCDDGIDCTDNSCFAGVCTSLPTDRCGAGYYCSTDASAAPSGCVEVEPCDVDADCEDPNPCSADKCVNHKCTHPLCPDGGSCCTGVGCGECCGDSQCTHDDPCNPSICGKDLKCVPAPPCDSADKCCKSADGKSATCGECCVATDCADDGVDCTDEKCKANGAGFLTCTHEPNADHCPLGQPCDPRNDCVANQCSSPSDCDPPQEACKKVDCNGGSCQLSPVDCSHGQKCCATDKAPLGQCLTCCENRDCGDPGLGRCCMPAGTCAECCADIDCQLAMTNGGPTPQALVGGAETPCQGPRTCNVGKCADNTFICTATQKCCPGVGCVSALQLGCPATL